MNLEIGKVVKKLRQLRGMSLTTLAEKSGISLPYLSLIESGDRIPGIELLNSIASALDIPLSVIVFLSSDLSKLEKLDAKILGQLSGTITELLEDAFQPQQSLDL